MEARRNIEAKYRCADLHAVRQRAEGMGARRVGVLMQRDTFFGAPYSRLKLRNFGDGKAELISYRREDAARARGSDYMICAVAAPAQMEELLAHALGRVGVVAKRRELFVFQNTRIHLDEVDGLGTFAELETVLSSRTDADGHTELIHVAEALGLKADQMEAKPYVELMGDTPDCNRD
jgi:adenylate cyclase, class 2